MEIFSKTVCLMVLGGLLCTLNLSAGDKDPYSMGPPLVAETDGDNDPFSMGPPLGNTDPEPAPTKPQPRKS